MISSVSHLPRWFRIFASAGALALAGVTACVTATDRTEPGGDVPAEQAAEQARIHGPVGKVLETALEHGELSAEQVEVVEAIQADLRAEQADKQLVREQLRASAAAIVRAGSTDSEQLEQAVDQAAKAIAHRMRAGSLALQELHGILDARQRGLVADKLQERLAEHRDSHDRRAHDRRHFKRLASYLVLSALQIRQLETLKQKLGGDHEERARQHREEIDQLVEAFRGEDFPQQLDRFQANKLGVMHEHIAAASEHTDAVLTLLSFQQRAALADLIELGPEAVGLAD